MKLFERTDDTGWGNRLNLIDKNNVFVGYDYEQSCCENFGYEFRNSNGSVLVESPILDDFYFTKKHEEKPILGDYRDDGYSSYGFEITNGKETLWFVLYNYHNGYYSHGFEFGDNATTIAEGAL
jgi:hypothetical protein